MNRLKERLKKDEGAALALVLVMIILLSLWLMSVSILTQSSNAAINQTLVKSAQKSAGVALGVERAINCAQALPDASKVFDYPGCVTRTNDYLVGSKSNSCSTAGFVSDIEVKNIDNAITSYDPNYYKDKLFYEKSSSTMFYSDGKTWSLNNFSPYKEFSNIDKSTSVKEGTLKVNCLNPTYSGVVEPLASIMLVGTSSIGTIGVDSGIELNCPSTSTLTLAGGLLNNSARWSIPGDCSGKLKMGTAVDAQHVPKIRTVTGGCAGASIQPCDDSFKPEEMDPTVINSFVAGYIQYQNAYTPQVGGTAVRTGSNRCTLTSGNIDQTLLDSVLVSCGSRLNPVIFGPVNKFVTSIDRNTNQVTPLVFTVPSGKYFISPNYDQLRNLCDNGKTGSQLVFTAGTSINVKNGGFLQLCNARIGELNSFGEPVKAPVISTCNTFYGSPCSQDESKLSNGLFNSDPNVPFLRIESGSNLRAEGLVFAPNGWGSISSLSGAKIPQGIMLKALQLTVSGISEPVTSAAPGPCNGERCLQLTIKFKPSSTTPEVFYGLVQMRMRDNFLGFNNFGKSVSATSGTYRIDLWDLQRAS